MDSLRVLGMTIESNGSNNLTVSKLAKKTDNAIRLIRRVANRQQGLGEDNLVRLVHAFVMCHFTYVAAMHNWQRSERDKLNTLIRKTIKRALGLPMYTSSEKLMCLGMHNTLEEIAEAQERAQYARLSTTQAGRSILRELGVPPAEIESRFCGLPREQRERIVVAPIPRNVHPEHNVGRRRARAKALLGKAREEAPDCCFVDAARYPDGTAFVAVGIDHDGKITNSATVRTKSAEVAEQVAIALTLLDDKRTTIYSDSRTAVRAFAKGTVSEQVVRILRDKDIKSHTIIWFPAHMGQIEGAPPNLNESAHRAARGVVDRVATGWRDAEVMDNRDPPSSYNEVTKHFYMGRRRYPPPHRKLNRPQALTLRLLQVGAYPNPALLHRIYPEIQSTNACELCSDLADLEHMLWRCPALHDGDDVTSTKWEAALSSPDLEAQLWAVHRARDAAERLSLSVPTWERPATC